MLPSRRGVLEIFLALAAAPGGSEFLDAWLRAAQDHQHGGSTAPPEPPLLREYTPKFFDPTDFEALQSFTEILIPTDETPGAREAHCAHFIDFLLQSPGQSRHMGEAWRAALAALREAGFHAADAQGRLTLVEAISRPERDKAATHPAYFAYELIKAENTFAFYTSRAGMIETLDYKGNSYNVVFPACDHPEHHRV